MVKIFAGLVVFLASLVLLVPKTWLIAGVTIHNSIRPADAIVVLAGDYKDRVPAAAELFHEKYAPLVILANDGVFSSWSTRYSRNLYQVEWSEEDLVKKGVPRKNIVELPFYGSSTMFDALAARKYLLKHQLKDIIIVSSDYHTRRALWTFRFVLNNTSVRVAAYPAKSHGIGKAKVILEYIKLGYYMIRYGWFHLVPVMHEVGLVAGGSQETRSATTATEGTTGTAGTIGMVKTRGLREARKQEKQLQQQKKRQRQQER